MQEHSKTSRTYRRAVVTGVGLVSPVGIGTSVTWNNIVAGKPGIERTTLFNTDTFTCKIAGEVKGFNPEDFLDRKDVKKRPVSRNLLWPPPSLHWSKPTSSWTRLMASALAFYVGSGIGGFEAIEREHEKLLEGGPKKVSPFFITATIVNLASGQISIRYGAKGPALACATACTTGAHAIGEAYRIIERGDADVIICGGAEAVVTPLAVAGFAAMRALSTRNDSPETASRPWDSERDGFVVGEGAGILILEERQYAIARGAKILAELVGYARNSDAHHANAPLEDGHGVRRVMELTLDDAGLGPSDIQYLNAHATSTPLGDRAEALAITGAFGEHAAKLAVSSTKSMTGHLLGGSGSLEAGLTVLALQHQLAPPTINLVQPDDACQFDLIGATARPLQMKHAMTNSFGFGGANASLIFRREDE